MKLKSFFASSVQAAIEKARDEMGSDALIVESRKAPPESRPRGEWEVVVAADADSAPKPPKAVQTAAAGAPPPVPPDLRRDLAEIRREVQGMRQMLSYSALSAAAGPVLGDTLRTLLEAGVDHEIAAELVDAVNTRMHRLEGGSGSPGFEMRYETRAPVARSGFLPAIPSPDPRTVRRELVAELESRLTSMDGNSAAEMAGPLALVGGPGCGKTTTLVKLAVRFGLEQRRPVRLVSFDTDRVAAGEPLRSYASVLGVRFVAAREHGSNRELLAGRTDRELILVDVPGYSACESQDMARMAQKLSEIPGLETHLVLSTTTGSADLTAVVDRFSVFRPLRLLFTMLDETGRYGGLLSQILRSGRTPLFLSTGPRIPEDLEMATRTRLVELLLTGRSGRAMAAA